MNLADWSTITLWPNFWWRLKFLFKPHDISFCWGKEEYFLMGFDDQEYLSIGGVPTKEEHRFKNEH